MRSLFIQSDFYHTLICPANHWFAGELPSCTDQQSRVPYLSSVSPLEAYYDNLPAPYAETLLACRDFILGLQLGLDPVYKWRIPVFDWKGNNLCYFHYEAKKNRCYIAFSSGRLLECPLLRAEGRKNMRFIVLNPEADLPVEAIQSCIEQVIAHLSSGGKAWSREAS